MIDPELRLRKCGFETRKRRIRENIFGDSRKKLCGCTASCGASWNSVRSATRAALAVHGADVARQPRKSSWNRAEILSSIGVPVDFPIGAGAARRLYRLVPCLCLHSAEKIERKRACRRRAGPTSAAVRFEASDRQNRAGRPLGTAGCGESRVGRVPQGSLRAGALYKK